MPKPTERATLVVNGVKFEDWKTVAVEHRWKEPFHIFTFSCSERAPIPKSWPLLQFKPGDRCQIYLAGILAMDGYITTRQVAYDANDHGVQLIGKSLTWDVAKSSVRTRNGNFDGNTWTSIARSVLAPFGCGLEIIGNLNDEPFPYVQVSPGELAFDFLERYARFRSIILGSNSKGELVACGQTAARGVKGVLEEGGNILRAQCVISHEHANSEYFASGQVQSPDASNADPNNKQLVSVASSVMKRYSPLETPTEAPVPINQLVRRVEFEAQIRDSTLIEAHITVQGWLNGNDLWRVGPVDGMVWVKSPMLMLDQMLAIRRAKFTQGPDGTLTELECVLPKDLNSREDFSGQPDPRGRQIS